MLSTRAGCTVHSAREAAGTPENHPRATCTLACGADGPSQPRLAPPLRIPHSLTARGEVISVCVELSVPEYTGVPGLRVPRSCFPDEFVFPINNAAKNRMRRQRTGEVS